jgi:hypothetical protein
MENALAIGLRALAHIPGASLSRGLPAIVSPSPRTRPGTVAVSHAEVLQ